MLTTSTIFVCTYSGKESFESPVHSVSFIQIHSGGDDDDACLMGGLILQN